LIVGQIVFERRSPQSLNQPVYISSVNGNDTLSITSPHTYLNNPGTGTQNQISGPDGRADFYTAEIISSREYSAYGAELPGYSYTTSGEYRYQFQNQEVDEEFWSGAVSYKYRIEDARLGRFFSVDPLAPKYAYNSVYAFSENRVIDGVELEGLERIGIVATPNGNEVVLIRVINWQEISQQEREAWMLGWNVDEEYFNGHEKEFWTSWSKVIGNDSYGTEWNRYALPESYKNGEGKPYDEDWTGDIGERFRAFDSSLSEPANGMAFDLTVASIVFTAGSWAAAVEATGGLGAAIMANRSLLFWDTANLILDINGLTADPLGVTFLEQMFGAQNNSVVMDWFSVSMCVRSSAAGTFNLAVKLKDGSSYEIVYDSVNLVFTDTKSFLDMKAAIESIKHEEELKNAEKPIGQ
jgi:RHS repeat-associated protein